MIRFKGYRRPDGAAGVRNHVLVIPAVVCANRVVRGIAQQVSGATWIEHQHHVHNLESRRGRGDK
jgi:altronate dehydratase large subunit